MRYAVIENGVVVNVALADAPLAANWIQSDTAAIGDLYADGAFAKPPTQQTPVPDEVTNAQAREALIRSGISIASVNSAIQAITNPVEREVAFVQWEYRDKIRRNAELVRSMGVALNLSDSQIDDLFRYAITL